VSGKAPTLAHRLAVSPDVVFRELDGEAVLLDLERGAYFGLNTVGTRIWALIQERASLRAVLEALQAEYEAAPDVLERDLLGLAGRLCDKGLARVIDA